MFSVHIEIAMLASPVNHSVNLRTVNNMGFQITPLHYSIRKCVIYAQRTDFQTRKGQKHVDHVRIWTDLAHLSTGINLTTVSQHYSIQTVPHKGQLAKLV